MAPARATEQSELNSLVVMLRASIALDNQRKTLTKKQRGEITKRITDATDLLVGRWGWRPEYGKEGI